MRKLTVFIAGIATFLCASTASAQYYEIANQLSGLISPALSGSFKYKGYVDISGTAGIGTARANFLGVSTTQGYQYASWFFMGVGMGVDVVMAPQTDVIASPPHYPNDDYSYYNGSRTKAMIPVFTDFRFNIGRESSPSFFTDIKIGAAWLLGNSYLILDQGCVSTQTQFYLKPTLGLRLPVNRQKPRRAINIGITYQLLTSNNRYYSAYGNSVTLNNLGVTIAYEW